MKNYENFVPNSGSQWAKLHDQSTIHNYQLFTKRLFGTWSKTDIGRYWKCNYIKPVIWALPTEERGIYWARVRDKNNNTGLITINGRTDMSSHTIIASNSLSQCPFTNKCYTTEITTNVATENVFSESRKYYVDIKDEFIFDLPGCTYKEGSPQVTSDDKGFGIIIRGASTLINPVILDEHVGKCYNVLTIESGLVKCTNTANNEEFYLITDNSQLLCEMVKEYTLRYDVEQAFILKQGTLVNIMDDQNEKKVISIVIALDKPTKEGVQLVPLNTLNILNAIGDANYFKSISITQANFRKLTGVERNSTNGLERYSKFDLQILQSLDKFNSLNTNSKQLIKVISRFEVGKNNPLNIDLEPNYRIDANLTTNRYISGGSNNLRYIH